MNRREFLRLSAAAGTALAGGGILSGCDMEALALTGVRIVDPHAHPDQFYADNPANVDESSTLATIVEIGMVASSFSAIGDRNYAGAGVPGVQEYQHTNYQLSKVEALAAAGQVRKVLKASDIPFALGPGVPPGAILSIEGGDPLTSDTVGADPFAISTQRLNAFYGLGVRIITINHYRNNDLGDCQNRHQTWDPGPPNGGLTELGAHVVTEMQKKGMLVDVAHSNPATLQGIVELAKGAKKPVIDSHTSPHPDGDLSHYKRLRTRDEMERIAETGGVVCSWPYAYSTGTVTRRTFTDWAREIVAMKKALGMEHVGLGTDGGGVLPEMIDGYRGVQDLGKLALEMRIAGLSQKDVAAFFGGNLLRVLKACIG
jgi:membrane dipeptidase